MKFWQTYKRQISFNRSLVIGILNITPDSFSDGGRFLKVDDALTQAEKMIAEGAYIIDIGGESTRPGSERISETEEMDRIVSVIEAVARRFDIPISIDTSRSAVAEAGVNAGAEIINDISGLRFDEGIADVAAKYKTGLLLMHSRGTFETLHSQPPVDDILTEVSNGFRRMIDTAAKHGVKAENIALDVGIGFGKTFEQNLELIAKLDRLVTEFPDHPIAVGTSRKSFLGRILDDVSPDERLQGSLASVAISVWNGVKIVRVHDVKETVGILRVVGSIGENR